MIVVSVETLKKQKQTWLRRVAYIFYSLISLLYFSTGNITCCCKRRSNYLSQRAAIC